VNGELHFTPFLPANWQSFSFKIKFRGALFMVKISKEGAVIEQLDGDKTEVWINGQKKGVVAHYANHPKPN
jgi:maltose phosphorylase